MDHIDLINTMVEDQYNGVGNAFLIMENGQPTKLIYENPEIPAIRKELSEDELVQLFVDHEVDFEELEEKQGVILIGTCSCFQFTFPEIFIDFKN